MLKVISLVMIAIAIYLNGRFSLKHFISENLKNEHFKDHLFGRTFA